VKPRGRADTHATNRAPDGSSRGSSPPADASDPRGVAPAHDSRIARSAALLLAAAAIVWSVTFHLPDTDTWQHLTVGRAIWTTHAIPTREVWTWPTYGAPDVNPSWGFSAVIWPFFAAGGTWGLLVWRWLATLATFALLAVAARALGARGFGLPAAFVACATLYRLRAEVRPETLAAILLAAEIAILELRRAGRRDLTAALPAVALVWANAHISAFLFFVVLGAFALDDLVARRAGAPARGRLRLPVFAALALLAMLVNPWGWRTLAQPFEYFFVWRHEPIFATIGELGRPRWSEEIWNGALVIGLAVPLLCAWHWWRRGFDLVETIVLLVFGAMALSSMRFLGFLALAIAPYFARDLDDWLATRPVPRALAHPWLGCAGVALVVLGVAVPSWSLPGANMGVGDDLSQAPVAACDFLARHGIRGRDFNEFELGGYLLWRFWPERDRLPFMDVHQAGTHADRLAYTEAFRDPDAWRALDANYRFDWVLLRHPETPDETLLDTLDADSTWALVFMDDVAVLYARRGTVAAALAYRTVPAGHEGLRRLGEECTADSARRDAARAEFARVTSESRRCASAHVYLALLAQLDRHPTEALRQQQAALAIDDDLPHGFEQLGDLALAAGEDRQALAAWRRAGPDHGPGLDRRIGIARMGIGDRKGAIAAFHRALKQDPGDSEAADSLARLEGRSTGD